MENLKKEKTASFHQGKTKDREDLKRKKGNVQE